MISTAPALADLISDLARFDPIALDTEADSLHCYFEKLCLIQISFDGRDVLVDPLAGLDLGPLFGILAGRELLIHGADYDLRLMRRAGFTEPRAVFDTMIAARLTGHAEFSLAALVKQYFGVELVKGSQKANWARRPLSEQMEAYARNDTHFLAGLAGNLEARLREMGRWEWFEQSCAKAVATARIDKERDVDAAWRISGSSDLRGRASALVRALWLWRDAEARAADRPAFHVLQNDRLIDAAGRIDRGEQVSIAHFSPSRQRRFSAAVQATLALPPEEWPQPIRKPRNRPTQEQERLFAKLKTRRDATATRLQLDPALIAPKATLEQIASDPESAAARLMAWQLALLEPIS
ncbi:MAG: HRDC domain-containing protein [Chthoniobacteraceae bacterium]